MLQTALIDQERIHGEFCSWRNRIFMPMYSNPQNKRLIRQFYIKYKQQKKEINKIVS